MNGIIKFEKRVKLGDFEHELAAAEISFSDEFPDDGAARAAAEARSRVLEMLGLAKPTVRVSAIVASDAALAVAQVIKDHCVEVPDPCPSSDFHYGVAPAMSILPEVKAENERKSAEIGAGGDPRPDPIVPVVSGGPAPSVTHPVADTHGGVVDIGGQITTGIGPIERAAKSRRKAAKAETPDPAAIGVVYPVVADAPLADEWTSAAQEYTNADLGRACSNAQERLSGSPAENRERIAKLIGKFIGPGKKLAELPQGTRPQFITELAQLT